MRISLNFRLLLGLLIFCLSDAGAAAASFAPVLNANDLMNLSARTNIRIERATLTPFEINLSGRVTLPDSFRSSHRIYVHINQQNAQSLSRFPKSGSVLFARAEVVQDQLQIHISGQRDVVSAVWQIWNSTKNLDGLIDEISIEFAARYVFDIEPIAPAALDELANRCGPSLSWKMECPVYADWTYQSSLNCLDTKSDQDDYLRYVRILDPFVTDLDQRVRLRAVTHDLCDMRSKDIGPAIALTIASASKMLEASDHRKPVRAETLSLIKMKAEVLWQPID